MIKKALQSALGQDCELSFTISSKDVEDYFADKEQFAQKVYQELNIVRDMKIDDKKMTQKDVYEHISSTEGEHRVNLAPVLAAGLNEAAGVKPDSGKAIKLRLVELGKDVRFAKDTLSIPHNYFASMDEYSWSEIIEKMPEEMKEKPFYFEAADQEGLSRDELISALRSTATIVKDRHMDRLKEIISREVSSEAILEPKEAKLLAALKRELVGSGVHPKVDLNEDMDEVIGAIRKAWKPGSRIYLDSRSPCPPR